MRDFTKRFRDDETGAVTVDWVVLSAALIGIGLIVLVPIAYGTGSMADLIAEMIAGLSVGYGAD